jgi:hypothetical protein
MSDFVELEGWLKTVAEDLFMQDTRKSRFVYFMFPPPYFVSLCHHYYTLVGIYACQVGKRANPRRWRNVMKW